MNNSAKRWLDFEYGADAISEVVDEAGDVWYFVSMCVGGRDDEGDFVLVTDGPAQGEKVYNP